ncbi:hypothetical protein N657DRAFT_675876 [Parathielavia appendiculata]|uniref:C2H2-type domain-containing protein n=1 Tax=Parathielavia appendiculata TaxID=2587402 RepID=A0AAN6Z7L6_9PEZI|nr:hypothetical protein N657DRAFT_675876 [Parathielavia appendiculata]
MSHPASQQSGPKRHVLHRQPRVPSLNRKRESAEETTRAIEITGAAAELRHSGPQSVEAASSHVARYSTSLHAPHDRCSHTIPSAFAAHSFEWETETLFEPGTCTPPLDSVSYPCPFRKRNPARFNFRDHEDCARGPFSSVLELIHHIRNQHRRQPIRHQCRRCKHGFGSEMELEQHSLLPREQMCEVISLSLDDPEDGITDEMARTLVTAEYAPEGVWSWEKIWHWVFPNDSDVPDPDFPPYVELVDVEQAFDEGQQTLKASLREKLKLLLPEPIGDDYLSFLTGQLELVFEIHRVNVLKPFMGRSWAIPSRETPRASQAVQQQKTTRKPNRRSRRSTMLQALYRNPNTSETAEVPPSLRHSRTGSTKRTSLLSNDQSAHRITKPHTQFPAAPASPSKCLASDDPAPPPHDPAYTSKLDPNPRDSRDSGIGMPCEACDEPDACRCHGALASELPLAKLGDHDDSPKRHHHQHEHGHGVVHIQEYLNRQHQATEPPECRIGSAADTPCTTKSPCTTTTGTLGLEKERVYCIHRPRLSLDTNSVPPTHIPDLPRANGVLAEASVTSMSAGGRFSPESFKQRVLRGRLMSG